ncbi:SMI1/KNR4 family protein [Paenibacillus sp. H1-7]|uniref:SMI1/KNR4 family protein n=1 Tax=Paenibacillus sp. H1-7 TaxID=2282849 RepID=UPI001EF85567|nr:SMI1/KNR4 family protein [Paenibacillus sp. H1-7]ULL16525.1 SMI1/KNR4 family protein [Paenibacillus sp. H1-7]
MKKLIDILPPPTTPFNCGDQLQWEYFINRLGTKVPSDYRQFINTYGTGGIDKFLWILNPFVKDENVNFLKRKEEICTAYLQSKLAFPQYFEHEVFPSTGGILPWGYTDNGDELYWLTFGNPDEWTIVVYTSRSSEYFHYPIIMTEFLYQIIMKEIVCDSFPDDFPFPNKKTEFFSFNVH